MGSNEYGVPFYHLPENSRYIKSEDILYEIKKIQQLKNNESKSNITSYNKSNKSKTKHNDQVYDNKKQVTIIKLKLIVCIQKSHNHLKILEITYLYKNQIILT